MPKSSRHKSHRQSKHGSKDTKEYSESEEDAKMRAFNKEEGSTRVSRNSGSSEKRKDHPGLGNGDIGEEYVSSKRRREKEREKGDAGVASDRWNGGGGSNEVKGESLLIGGEKSSKLKTGADSKSKSEKKEEGKVESKRKHDKESGRKEAQQGKDSKEFKEKAKVNEKEKEKERKAKDKEREVEDEVVDIGDAVIPSVGYGEEQDGRHGRENNVWPIEDQKNPESEKDLEKRRRNKDGANEKDRYLDDIKESGDRRISSKGDRSNDGKYKDEKYSDVSHGDKHREDGDRDARYKDEKYADDIDRERKCKDAKYRESSEKVYRHKDDSYREDAGRDKRSRDDKYRDGGDRDNKYRDAKYREEADNDYRRRVDKYHEDVDRDDRHRDDWYFEENSRDGRNRDEKNWEDAGRDNRRREVKKRDDTVKDKRVCDIKYQDERLVRDGTKDNADLKRSRDESEASEFRHRRPANRDVSPSFDDRGTRNKDDRGKRRINDKEDYDDVRNRSMNDQYYDIEKKSTSSARVESLANRGRSTLRDADMVISPNHGRRGNSPSYRVIKQEESRYREYIHGGRERREPRDVTPAKEYTAISGTEKVFRSNEKFVQKDDGRGDEPSTERPPKEDTHTSPVQGVDKSPSSASNDRRTLNRADVRRSLDVEDSGQRSGGSREIKDYYTRDNRGNRDLPLENLPGDEISQPDTDNISASSPFGKQNYFNNNNRSQKPPTPFRSGPDRPFDDENRNKQNRRRRMDSNVGRPQGNAWRGVPNWPSPVANGFVPFQHGPTPMGFHPVMQQFQTGPMFGIRPSMELNQSGLPFHVHENDRYTGHVRPLGWDTNNSMFGDESHLYGRLDWDHNRSLNGGRGWENNRDLWKGPNSNSNPELTSAPHRDDQSVHRQGDEPPAQTEKRQSNDQVESVGFDDPSDAVEREHPKEAPIAIAEDISDPETKEDDYFSRAYLSVLDISEELSQCELYSKYTSLVGMDRNGDPEEHDSKLLIMEEDIDALGKDSNKASSASLFRTMDDSIFQRAMSLYKKLKEEVLTVGQDKVPVEPVVPVSDDKQPMEVLPATIEPEETEIVVSELSNKVKIEASFENIGYKTDEQIVVTNDGEGKSDEPVPVMNVVKMEIDPVVIKEEILDDFVQEGSSSSPKEVNLNDGKFVSKSVNLSRIHLSSESTH